jgi:hypothetical protein
LAQHDLAVLRKDRVRKTLGKGVGNHEVGPKRNESDTTSSIQLVAKMSADVPVERRFHTN